MRHSEVLFTHFDEMDYEEFESLLRKLTFSRRLANYILNKFDKLDVLADLNVDRIIFNNPATIVYWKDGTKTVVRVMDTDTFSKEAGFTAALAKRAFGGHNQYKNMIERLGRDVS